VTTAEQRAEALAEAEQTVRAARLSDQTERYGLAKAAIGTALDARGLQQFPLQIARWAGRMAQPSVTGPRSRAR